MSKFNTKAATVYAEPDTTNLAGGKAYSQSAEVELASILLTSFVEDQYYRGADQTLTRVKELVGQVDPIFAAKAALYARDKGNMRSISHVVAGELAARVKGETWTKGFYDKVVIRPDDATEILSYYFGNYGKTVPNSLKKGLAKSLGKFDEYQLGKYRGEGNDVSLVDVVNLTHPKATPRNGDALKKLVEGTLRNKSTWNAKLSAAGSDKDAKATVWADFLANPKWEYMALLRNLRNIAEQAPELVDDAAKKIQDADRIRKSRVLPFRFAVALKELSQYPKYQRALSNALDISTANMPEFGNALVVVDTSGSMRGRVAGSEKFTCVELGALFGAALAAKSGADVMAFADSARYVTIRPQDSALTNAERIHGTQVGYGTNFNDIFAKAKKKYDNIIIFSDMQAWVDNHWGSSRGTKAAFDQYKKRVGASPNVFSFDLTGYGSMQFPTDKVYQIAGFSDRVFDVMGVLKDGNRNALVDAIKAEVL